jgi:hypothetical protein
MKSYKCIVCENEINIDDFVIVHKITNHYYCSFECEGTYLIEKYDRSLTSDEFEENGREEFILSSDDFEE